MTKYISLSAAAFVASTTVASAQAVQPPVVDPFIATFGIPGSVVIPVTIATAFIIGSNDDDSTEATDATGGTN